MILPDYLAPGLKVVFCGTAAGRVSAQAGHYYANPGNRFWTLLCETGLTPHRLAPSDDHLLNSFGMGLTDLAKTVFGQDAQIPRDAWDSSGLITRIRSHQPRNLAFTSLTAARLALGRKQAAAGMLEPDLRLPGVTLWALTSSSGLARRHFSAEPWHALARQVSR